MMLCLMYYIDVENMYVRINRMLFQGRMVFPSSKRLKNMKRRKHRGRYREKVKKHYTEEENITLLCYFLHCPPVHASVPPVRRFTMRMNG